MEYNDQVKNRVKRMEGQLRGILKMMEEEKDCKEVITQLSAVRSAQKPPFPVVSPGPVAQIESGLLE